MGSALTNLPATAPLLFDLGGVIVDIRRQNCIEAFQRLGFQDIAQFLGDYGQQGPFLLVEEGAISPDEFRNIIRRHIPTSVTDQQIDDAFNAFIVGIPLHRLQALRRLRQDGHPTYVISNTNKIMWESSLKRAFEQEGLRCADYFDGIVTSFEAKCCKPAPGIFNQVVERFHINPAETIFFDDSLDNCKAAEALGFKAVHVPEGTEFTDLLSCR
jgi:putative hydrolase of the HAD superfamily